MKKFWCLFFIFWPIVAIIIFWISPGMNWWFPGESYSPLGAQIDDLFYLILWIVAVVFVGTQIGLGYVLWKGATSKQDDKAWYSHGSHSLEVMWTIVPAGILLFIALYQMDVWAQYRIKANFPENTLTAPIAELTARQFEWRVRYPHPDRKFKSEADVKKWLRQPHPDDLHTVNDLRVPSGKPVLIYLRTEDVQHSFFVPKLRVKQDAVPGLVIPVWFEVQNRAGENEEPELKGSSYEFLCAELCGWGHYKMKARLVAQPEKEFKTYIDELQADQNEDGVSSDDEQE